MIAHTLENEFAERFGHTGVGTTRKGDPAAGFCSAAATAWPVCADAYGSHAPTATPPAAEVAWVTDACHPTTEPKLNATQPPHTCCHVLR